jgi:predicted MFS family arabinose efflux permease
MDYNDILPESYILKYYVFISTGTEVFIAPILTLFFLSRGLTYGEIGIISSIWWFGWAFSEIPSGYIGDRLGRRNGLILGNVIQIISMVALFFAQSFAAIVVAQILRAVGITFRSGTLSAWLYDMLKDRLGTDEFSRIQGRGRAIALAVGAIASVTSGYLAEINIAYPLLATALSTLVGLIVVMTFPQSNSGNTDESLGAFEAIRIIRKQFANPPLRSFVVYTGLFTGLIYMVYTFIQPMVQNYGLGLFQIGVLYAGFTGTAAIGSYFTNDIKEMIGIRGWFLSVPFVLSGLVVSILFLPLVMIPTLLLMRAVDHVTRTLRSQYINDRSPSVGRATILSTAAMIYALTAIPFQLGGGFIATQLSPRTTVVLVSAVTLVMLAAVVLTEVPVPQETDSYSTIDAAE